MERVERLFDFSDDAEALRRAVNDIFKRKYGDARGIQPLCKEATQIRWILIRLGGSLDAFVRKILEILDAGGFFGELKIEIVQRRLECHITHHGAQHVEEHGAF